MAYADYEYYQKEYKGSLTQREFEAYAEKASRYIDYITMNRAKSYSGSDIQKACCAVAEAYSLNSKGGGLASETVGKWTRNYLSGVSKSQTNEERLYTAAKQSLAATGLLYRGVRQ